MSLSSRAVAGDMVQIEDTKFYCLRAELQEKEESVELQKIGRVQTYEGWDVYEGRAKPSLSPNATNIGKFFTQYIKGSSLPGRPDGSDRTGFYIEDSEFLAFRGRGGKDLASMWHMLVIPRDDTIRWVMDLTAAHLEMLGRMRAAFFQWVSLNRDYFLEKYKGMASPGPEFWLQEDQLHLGFHISPTVGVLHMHAMIGPLTEYGSSPELFSRWIPLSAVINLLESEGTLDAILR